MTAAVMKISSTGSTPVERLTLRCALQLGVTRLFEAGVESARLDTEVLLRHVLQLDQSEFYLRLEDRLSAAKQAGFRRLLERRAGREPLAYITGRKEFWSIDFSVSPAVLIPRPETELLVELALQFAREYRRDQAIKILDIGTGSGAIAVSLAMQLPDAEVWGTDVSSAAVGVAETNAKRHGINKRVRFVCYDLFHKLAEAGAIFDLIVANPPYIRSTELAGLVPEIRDWEPRSALDGGTGGVDFYPRIIGAAPDHLVDGGRVLLEIGSDQSQAVVDLFDAIGRYLPASVHRDYAGRARVVTAVKGTAHG
jgi:release factor glutamine methyltransferase